MSYSILRTGLVALAACLSVVIFFPQPASAQARPDADLAKLEGAWKIVRWQDQDFEKHPELLPKDFHDLRIVFKGDQMIWTGGEHTLSKTIKLDAAKSPKTIDLTFKLKRFTFDEVGDFINNPNPPKKAKQPEPMYDTFRLPGIYKLEGDRMTIAMIDVNDAKIRPSDFQVRMEPPTIVFVLVRVK